MTTPTTTFLRSRVFVCLAAALVAAGAWWAVLGWDTSKTLGSDGYLHGPYEPWQITILVVMLALLGVWLGHRHAPLTGALSAAAATAASFSVQAERAPENQGLWPIGAAMLLLGAFAGIAAAAFVSSTLSAAHRQRRQL